jgi:TP901 family phage tail tape measure protein
MSTLMESVVILRPDLDGFEREATRGVEGALSNVQDKADKFGRSMTRNVTLPILAVGGATITAANNFNAAMANVAALGVPIERVNELKTGIQELSVTTAKSTDDLADGMYNVVSAFGDGADTMSILETNARAAVAGLASTSDAINLTSAVTKAYGDTSARAVDRVANLALKAVEMGQTTFPELASSIGRVTPLANELGVSQEELFGVMATFTGVTGGAAEVSTQMRGALQALMAPTGDMTELMEELGYENGQAMIDALGFQGALAAITDQANKTGTPLKNFIGSIEGQTLALAGAGALADTWTEKTGAMGGELDTLNEAWSAQTEGINATGFQLAQARAEMAVTAQQMGDALMPVLADLLKAFQPIVESIRDMVERFNNLDESTQTNILRAVALIAAIGPVLVIFSKVIGVIKAVVTVFKLLNLAMLMNPIGLLVAALVVLGVILFKYRKEIGEWVQRVGAWFSGLGDKLREIFTRIGDTIRNVFQSAVGFVKGIINQLIGMFERVFNGPATAANALIKTANRIPGVNIPTLPTLSIPRLADGGDITRGGRVMVGEEGPEYLDLPRGARVTPLDKGGTTNITMNVTVQGGSFDEDKLARALDRIARDAAATSTYRRPQ